GTEVRKVTEAAAEAKPDGPKFDTAARQRLQSLVAGLPDATVRREMERLLPEIEQAAVRQAQDRPLLAEVKRLGGKAVVEVRAPAWLRDLAGDDGLAVFGRVVEIDLNERSDGHKAPVPKKLSDRVTDDWLKHLAGQDRSEE